MKRTLPSIDQAYSDILQNYGEFRFYLVGWYRPGSRIAEWAVFQPQAIQLGDSGMASKRRVAVAMDIDKPFRHHTLTFAGIHDYAEQRENWHLIVDDWADRTLPARADAGPIGTGRKPLRRACGSGTWTPTTISWPPTMGS